MKTNLLKTGVILFAAILICSGCNQRPKVQDNKGTNSKGQTASVEVGGYDPAKLAKMIVETIKTAPKAVELVKFLDEVGVSYMSNLTVPLKNAEKYLTVVDQSFALGMYVFDLIYANAYKRDDVVVQVSAVYRNLMGKLGMVGDVDMTAGEARVRKNQDNTDSLNVIVMDYWNQIGTSKYAMEHPGVFAQMYVGANIEGLYILTQVALMSKDNSSLINFVGQQKARMQANYSVLEMTAADEAVAPIFEKMKPIMEFFNKNEPFTIMQLTEVAPMIEKLRNEMVK
jgi:hypothetical protein